MKTGNAGLRLALASALLAGTASMASAWTYDTQVIEYVGNSNVIGTRPGTTYSYRVGVITNDALEAQDLSVDLNYHDGFIGQYLFSLDSGDTWLEVDKEAENFTLSDVAADQEIWLRAVIVYYRYLSSSPWGEADEALGDEYYFAFPPGGQYYDKGTTDVNKTGFVAVVNDGTEPPVGTVTSAGQTWMDRNLGADQVATSPTDEAAYGDLYQWGRLADGHESRTSSTTSEQSAVDIPGHANFIMSGIMPYDWRTEINNNLWQGSSGLNNPCPCGFRVPTLTEVEAERISWQSNNAAGAFASPTKLVVAGWRHNIDNNSQLMEVGAAGSYWTSTTIEYDPVWPPALYFDLSETEHACSIGRGRAEGNSVRCIMD